MSLRSMAVMRAKAEDRRAETESDPAADGEQKKLQDQLIALIPAEAVAGFVALIGAMAALEVGWRWAALIFVALLTPLYVFISYANSANTAEAKNRLPWFEMSVGILAFLAWSTTVPAGPFDEIGFKTQYGAAVVAASAILLTAAVNTKAAWRKLHPDGD